MTPPARRIRWKRTLKRRATAQRREDRLYADLKAQELLDLPPDQRMKEVLKMSPEEQRALSRHSKGKGRRVHGWHELRAEGDAEGPEQPATSGGR